MFENTQKKKIWKIVLFSLLMFLFIFCIYRVEFQNDTFFDIKLGEKYYQEGIVKQDDFSIHEGLEYVAQHFGVNMITYFVYAKFGFTGLYILGLLLSSLLAVILYALNVKFLKRKKLAYLILFIQMFILQIFLSIRAQMYSYILFGLEILWIEKFLEHGKMRYLLLLTFIPLLLINLHAGVVAFYFIILMVYLFNLLSIKFFKIETQTQGKELCRYLIIPLVVGILLIFINPFGVDSVLYGFKTLGNSFINQYIMEFQPLSMKASCGPLAYAYIAIFVFGFMMCKQKIKLHSFLLFIGTAFMTLLSIRHFALLIICSTTCLSVLEEILDILYNKINEGLNPKARKKISMTLLVVYLVFIGKLGMDTFFKNGKEYIPSNAYPVQALKFIEENIPEDARIFNEYTWGSLMMLENRKVFIDSRADLYTKEYNSGVNVAMDYIRINNCTDNYIKLLEKYDIDYVFVEKNASIAKNLVMHEEYKMIYQDNVACIIEKID